MNKISMQISLDEISKETSFCSRKPKKIHPSTFLAACMNVSIFNSASLTIIAFVSGIIGCNTVCKNAIYTRIKRRGVVFLKTVLERLLLSYMRSDKNSPLSNSRIDRFNRVLVQDSTTISLPLSLKEIYPGSSNQNRKSAGMKIQTVIDLKADRYVSFELTPYTDNDQSRAEDILELVEKGDLVMRDLGYYSIASLRGIEDRGGQFISRHFHRTTLYSSDRKRIDLLKQLKNKKYLDTILYIGVEDQLPVRLVAIPVPDEVANERRRKAKENRDKRSIPSKQQLALLGWEILITNISSEDLGYNDVYDMYSLRWRIENIFKVWKSYFRMADIPHKISVKQLECLIYARLINLTVFHEKVWKHLMRILDSSDKPPISLTKLAMITAECYQQLIACGDLEDEEVILHNLEKHSRYDKRKRQNYQEKLAKTP